MVAEALRIALDGSESAEIIGEKVAATIRSMLRTMNVRSLRDMGISHEKFMGVVEEACNGHLCCFSPRPVSMADTIAMAESMDNNYQ